MIYLRFLIFFFNFFLQYDHKRVTELSNLLVNGIEAGLTHVIRNGDPEHSYPGCVNLSFAFVEGESLLMALKDVALSSGRWEQNSALREFTNAIMSKCGHNHVYILYPDLLQCWPRSSVTRASEDLIRRSWVQTPLGPNFLWPVGTPKFPLIRVAGDLVYRQYCLLPAP